MKTIMLTVLMSFITLMAQADDVKEKALKSFHTQGAECSGAYGSSLYGLKIDSEKNFRISYENGQISNDSDNQVSFINDILEIKNKDLGVKISMDFATTSNDIDTLRDLHKGYNVWAKVSWGLFANYTVRCDIKP